VKNELALTFKKLSEDDFRILLGIEIGMRYHKWVPIEELVKYTRLSEERLKFRLKGLAKEKLVHRINKPYEGFRIYFEAYDILALNTFAKRETVSTIGGVIGVGKESVVYEGQSGLFEREIIIKFHREGMGTFKHVRRKRNYLGERQHISWIYASRLAAEREYKALTALYPTASVPEPIDHNRHAIVMERCNGKLLKDQHLTNPNNCLNEIMKQIDIAYKLGFIHGDLSEFNILEENGKTILIDWPQALKKDAPTASELLERDTTNILKFFKRRYNLTPSNQKYKK